MKTKIYFSLLSLVLTMSIFSCKDKESSSTANPIIKDTTEYFTCKINNVAYVDNSRFSDYSNGATRIISSNDDVLFRLDFKGEAIGEYIINATSTDNTIVYNDINQERYESVSGKITITEFNKTDHILSGTFNGTLKKAIGNTLITITDGKFNYVPLTQF